MVWVRIRKSLRSEKNQDTYINRRILDRRIFRSTHERLGETGKLVSYNSNGNRQEPNDLKLEVERVE